MEKMKRRDFIKLTAGTVGGIFLAGYEISLGAAKSYILIPMDDSQTNHLKAYGLVYWLLALDRGYRAEWLLNFRDGAFLTDDHQAIRNKANEMGVYFEVISPGEAGNIHVQIQDNNMESVLLEKAPRMAVYVPPTNQPWDDAVTLALNYAEIPFDKLWDKEVLDGSLKNYDWLHLHHEDFTGQYGKFYGSYRFASWYQNQVAVFEQAARESGHPTVPEHKRAVSKEIKSYAMRGGFLFAMCAATDTLDIALATDGTDIVASEIDSTPIDPGYPKKVDYSKTLAFSDFSIITDPFVYEYSDIDASDYTHSFESGLEDFTLFEFSAKEDPLPTMLTQCHRATIKGFFGQTTAFYKRTIKDNVIIMGEMTDGERAKYIHGSVGKGVFSFYGGHDPEDFQHLVGDPPTNLALHRDSAGYRLILNNVLFPAARKKERKT